jgi:hypothetical protein
MTKKCLMCGSERATNYVTNYPFSEPASHCQKCDFTWTDRQQTEIESLKAELSATNKKLALALDGLNDIKKEEYGFYDCDTCNKCAASQLADATLKAIAKEVIKKVGVA